MAKKTAKTAAKKPLTKTQLFSAIADDTGLTKKDVAAVFDSMTGLIKKEVGSGRGAGAFTVPGLLKIVRFKKKATKARMGRNPATGEEIKIAAKPASTVVKLRALKPLKEMV
ncbi:HU family DNA-binding protein [Mucisphaera sp.]|uniref:HU family DNA-binding protein n=1 Tax=Mucisphaera sp. TaxID=2913024 RepID=UPI003D15050F